MLFRSQLLADLATVSFSRAARPIIGKALMTKGGENLKRLVNAIDAQAHFVKVSERGQITTSIGNCRREVQPHLLLLGEPVVTCDISSAHWNFLPLILANRLHHVSGEGDRGKYVKIVPKPGSQQAALTAATVRSQRQFRVFRPSTTVDSYATQAA